MLLCGVVMKGAAGSGRKPGVCNPAGTACIPAQPHLVCLTTDLLHVTQNAALQKLCRSLRGAGSSDTAQREDRVASAPEAASSAGTADGAAAGGSNGTLPQGTSATLPAPPAAGGCAMKQGEAVGRGAASEAGPTAAVHLPIKCAAAPLEKPGLAMAAGENTVCAAGGGKGSAPGGAPKALAESPVVGAGAETAKLAYAGGSAAVGPDDAAVEANAGTAGPELGKV